MENPEPILCNICKRPIILGSPYTVITTARGHCESAMFTGKWDSQVFVCADCTPLIRQQAASQA